MIDPLARAALAEAEAEAEASPLAAHLAAAGRSLVEELARSWDSTRAACAGCAARWSGPVHCSAVAS